LKTRTPVNVGMSYTPSPSYAISAGYFYGTTYGVTLSLRGNAAQTYPQGLRIGPKPPPPAIRTDSEREQALVILRDSRTPKALGAAGPFVAVPAPEEYRRTALRQALMVRGLGIRSVEFVGKSVVVNSRLTETPAAQCERLARITAMTFTVPTDLIVNDLDDPKGRVAFCATTPSPTRLASVDVKPAVQSDAGSAPPTGEAANTKAFRQRVQYGGPPE
jgi:hypothetical protein